MAEEFLQGGVSWWNSPQNLFNSSLCSSAYNGIGSFDWPSNDLMMDTKTVWPASASEGSSSAAVQDVHQPDLNWNHEFLIDCGRSDQNYPNFLLENSNSNNFCEDSSIHTLDQSLLGNQSAPNSYQQVNSDGFLLSPSFKRPRIETPSPLPTFKVRKEKLGDRITALQQLVSPFGKTDTASVLHEAIEYIKFLHDQINAFSAPYVKYGSPPVQIADKQKDQKRQTKDLKTRGLCLVPIPTTFPVASETTNSDFWTPTFGRSFE